MEQRYIANQKEWNSLVEEIRNSNLQDLDAIDIYPDNNDSYSKLHYPFTIVYIEYYNGNDYYCFEHAIVYPF